MAEGDSTDWFSKTRAILGDLTNQLGKRGFSERGIKRSGYIDEGVVKRIRVSPHPSTGMSSSKETVVSSVSNLTNENREANVVGFGCSVVSKSPINVRTGPDDGLCLKGKNVAIFNSKDQGRKTSISQNFNVLDDDDNVKRDACGEISCFDDGYWQKMDKIANRVGSEVALDNSEISKGKDSLSLVDLGGQNAFQAANTEADELCDNFPIHISTGVTETGSECPYNFKDFNFDGSKASYEGTLSDIGDYQNDVDDHNAAGTVSSQCGSIDCTIIPESQESRVFGVEKSVELKEGDECALRRGSNSIKACSCSFCTQVARIWLDLNYQDIKARVSAIRKIQKEAIILAGKCIRSKVTEKHGGESLTTISELEFDLMHQWRSLFLHMAGIWEEEGNQLEARLPPLIDLIQKCQ